MFSNSATLNWGFGSLKIMILKNMIKIRNMFSNSATLNWGFGSLKIQNSKIIISNY